jgi:large subunit ribosomal protein L18
MFVQLIDDTKGVTLVGVRTSGKSNAARALGKELARIAQEKKITSVVFDKGSYRYHGRVKALAEGAREGGLIF